MQWLVRGAQPNDSLFFHCLYLIFVSSLANVVLTTAVNKSPGMVVRLKTSTAMRRTGTMKVRSLQPYLFPSQLIFRTVIYPVDFETNGHIVDDLMHDIMIKPLPPGCRMTAIFDVI